MGSHYVCISLGFLLIVSVCCSDNIVFPDQIVSNVNTETGPKFNDDDSSRFHKTNKFGSNTHGTSIHNSDSRSNQKPVPIGHFLLPNGAGTYEAPLDSVYYLDYPGGVKPGFPKLPGSPEFFPNGNSHSSTNANAHSQASNGLSSSNSKASAQSQGANSREPSYYPSNGHPNGGSPGFRPSVGGSQSNANAQSNSQGWNGHANSNAQANAHSQGPRHYGPPHHPSNGQPHRDFPNSSATGSSQASNGFSSSNSNSNSQSLGLGGGAASASSAASATTGIVNGRPVAAAAASAAAASAGGTRGAGASSVSSSSASSSGNYDQSPWSYRSRSLADDLPKPVADNNNDKILFLN